MEVGVYIPYTNGMLDNGFNSIISRIILTSDNSVIIDYTNNTTGSILVMNGVAKYDPNTSTIIINTSLIPGHTPTMISSLTCTQNSAFLNVIQVTSGSIWNLYTLKTSINYYSKNLDYIYSNPNYKTATSLSTDNTYKLTIAKIKISNGHAYIAMYTDYISPQIYVVHGSYDYVNMILTIITSDMVLPFYIESIQIRLSFHYKKTSDLRNESSYPQQLPLKVMCSDWSGLNGNPSTWINDTVETRIQDAIIQINFSDYYLTSDISCEFLPIDSQYINSANMYLRTSGLLIPYKITADSSGNLSFVISSQITITSPAPLLPSQFSQFGPGYTITFLDGLQHQTVFYDFNNSGITQFNFTNFTGTFNQDNSITINGVNYKGTPPPSVTRYDVISQPSTDSDNRSYYNNLICNYLGINWSRYTEFILNQYDNDTIFGILNGYNSCTSNLLIANDFSTLLYTKIPPPNISITLNVSEMNNNIAIIPIFHSGDVYNFTPELSAISLPAYGQTLDITDSRDNSLFYGKNIVVIKTFNYQNYCLPGITSPNKDSNYFANCAVEISTFNMWDSTTRTQKIQQLYPTAINNSLLNQTSNEVIESWINGNTFPNILLTCYDAYELILGTGDVLTSDTYNPPLVRNITGSIPLPLQTSFFPLIMRGNYFNFNITDENSWTRAFMFKTIDDRFITYDGVYSSNFNLFSYDNYLDQTQIQTVTMTNMDSNNPTITISSNPGTSSDDGTTVVHTFYKICMDNSFLKYGIPPKTSIIIDDITDNMLTDPLFSQTNFQHISNSILSDPTLHGECLITDVYYSPDDDIILYNNEIYYSTPPEYTYHTIYGPIITSTTFQDMIVSHEHHITNLIINQITDINDYADTVNGAVDSLASGNIPDQQTYNNVKATMAILNTAIANGKDVLSSLILSNYYAMQISLQNEHLWKTLFKLSNHEDLAFITGTIDSFRDINVYPSPSRIPTTENHVTTFLNKRRTVIPTYSWPISTQWILQTQTPLDPATGNYMELETITRQPLNSVLHVVPISTTPRISEVNGLSDNASQAYDWDLEPMNIWCYANNPNTIWLPPVVYITGAKINGLGGNVKITWDLVLNGTPSSWTITSTPSLPNIPTPANISNYQELNLTGVDSIQHTITITPHVSNSLIKGNPSVFTINPYVAPSDYSPPDFTTLYDPALTAIPSQYTTSNPINDIGAWVDMGFYSQTYTSVIYPRIVRTMQEAFNTSNLVSYTNTGVAFCIKWGPTGTSAVGTPPAVLYAYDIDITIPDSNKINMTTIDTTKLYGTTGSPGLVGYYHVYAYIPSLINKTLTSTLSSWSSIDSYIYKCQAYFLSNPYFNPSSRNTNSNYISCNCGPSDPPTTWNPSYYYSAGSVVTYNLNTYLNISIPYNTFVVPLPDPPKPPGGFVANENVPSSNYYRNIKLPDQVSSFFNINKNADCFDFTGMFPALQTLDIEISNFALVNNGNYLLFNSTTNLPNINEVSQGYLGDCVLESTLSSLAQNQPNFIKQSIYKDTVYSDIFYIRLFYNTNPFIVRIRASLPLDSNYLGLYEEYYTDPVTNKPVIWSHLYIKAIACLIGFGNINSDYPSLFTDFPANYYGYYAFGSEGIGFNPVTLMSIIIGNITNAYDQSQFSYLCSNNIFNNPNNICLICSQATFISDPCYANLGISWDDVIYYTLTDSSNPDAHGTLTVVGGHAYTVLSYDSTKQVFTLRNPWDNAIQTNINISFNAVKCIFGGVDICVMPSSTQYTPRPGAPVSLTPDIDAFNWTQCDSTFKPQLSVQDFVSICPNQIAYNILSQPFINVPLAYTNFLKTIVSEINLWDDHGYWASPVFPSTSKLTGTFNNIYQVINQLESTGGNIIGISPSGTIYYGTNINFTLNGPSYSTSPTAYRIYTKKSSYSYPQHLIDYTDILPQGWSSIGFFDSLPYAVIIDPNTAPMQTDSMLSAFNSLKPENNGIAFYINGDSSVAESYVYYQLQYSTISTTNFVTLDGSNSFFFDKTNKQITLTPLGGSSKTYNLTSDWGIMGGGLPTPGLPNLTYCYSIIRPNDGSILGNIDMICFSGSNLADSTTFNEMYALSPDSSSVVFTATRNIKALFSNPIANPACDSGTIGEPWAMNSGTRYYNIFGFTLQKTPSQFRGNYYFGTSGVITIYANLKFDLLFNGSYFSQQNFTLVTNTILFYGTNFTIINDTITFGTTVYQLKPFSYNITNGVLDFASPGITNSAIPLGISYNSGQITLTNSLLNQTITISDTNFPIKNSLIASLRSGYPIMTTTIIPEDYPFFTNTLNSSSSATSLINVIKSYCPNQSDTFLNALSQRDLFAILQSGSCPIVSSDTNLDCQETFGDPVCVPNDNTLPSMATGVQGTLITPQIITRQPLAGGKQCSIPAPINCTIPSIIDNIKGTYYFNLPTTNIIFNVILSDNPDRISVVQSQPTQYTYFNSLAVKVNYPPNSASSVQMIGALNMTYTNFTDQPGIQIAVSLDGKTVSGIYFMDLSSVNVLTTLDGNSRTPINFTTILNTGSFNVVNPSNSTWTSQIRIQYINEIIYLISANNNGTWNLGSQTIFSLMSDVQIFNILSSGNLVLTPSIWQTTNNFRQTFQTYATNLCGSLDFTVLSDTDVYNIWLNGVNSCPIAANLANCKLWSSSAIYSTGDIVAYAPPGSNEDSKYYSALQTNTNNAPSDGQNTTLWKLCYKATGTRPVIAWDINYQENMLSTAKTICSGYSSSTTIENANNNVIYNIIVNGVNYCPVDPPPAPPVSCVIDTSAACASLIPTGTIQTVNTGPFITTQPANGAAPCPVTIDCPAVIPQLSIPNGGLDDGNNLPAASMTNVVTIRPLTNPGFSSIPNWIFTGYAGIANGWTRILPQSGNAFLWLQTFGDVTSTAQTTITGLTAGQTYNLNMYVSYRYDTNINTGEIVTININDMSHPIVGTYLVPTYWSPVSYSFTATAITASVVFSIAGSAMYGPHDSTYFIDSLTVSPAAAAPEPAPANGIWNLGPFTQTGIASLTFIINNGTVTANMVDTYGTTGSYNNVNLVTGIVPNTSTTGWYPQGMTFFQYPTASDKQHSNPAYQFIFYFDAGNNLAVYFQYYPRNNGLIYASCCPLCNYGTHPALSINTDLTQINFTDQGYWIDNSNRVLPNSLGVFTSVIDCQIAASRAGYNVIGIQANGQCWAGSNIEYMTLGPATGCTNVLGCDWVNHIFTMPGYTATLPDPSVNPWSDWYRNGKISQLSQQCSNFTVPMIQSTPNSVIYQFLTAGTCVNNSPAQAAYNTATNKVATTQGILTTATATWTAALAQSKILQTQANSAFGIAKGNMQTAATNYLNNVVLPAHNAVVTATTNRDNAVTARTNALNTLNSSALQF